MTATVELLPRLDGGERSKLIAASFFLLAAVTAPTMPLLAVAKRRVGRKLGSSATVSEGAQNLVCA